MIEKNELILYEGKTYIASEIKGNKVKFSEYIYNGTKYEKIGKSITLENSDNLIKISKIQLVAKNQTKKEGKII